MPGQTTTTLSGTAEANKEACWGATVIYQPGGTVPPGGYHVTIPEAQGLEADLERGSGSLLSEAAPLQQAIDGDDESQMFAIFQNVLSDSECAPYDVTIPT